MNKAREFHEFLTELQAGVRKKEAAERDRLDDASKKEEYTQDLQVHHAYTEGQLYELCYILDNFWKIYGKD